MDVAGPPDAEGDGTGGPVAPEWAPDTLAMLDNSNAYLRDLLADLGLPWDSRTKRTLGVLGHTVARWLTDGVADGEAPDVLVATIASFCAYLAEQGAHQ